MTYELKGPGGVGIGYGSRTTKAPTGYSLKVAKTLYTGFANNRSYTTAEIAIINASIASGAVVYAPGSVLWNSDTGVNYSLTGLGVGAQFTVTGSGSSSTSSARVLVANRCGWPNLRQDNLGTAGLNGKTTASYGVSGLKTVTRATAGSGGTPGVYSLVISGGGSPTITAAGTYTILADGTASATVTITQPGAGYSSVPTIAAGASGGTVPTFTGTIGNTANEYSGHEGYVITQDCTDIVLEIGNFIGNASSPGQTDPGPSNCVDRYGVRINGVASAIPVFGYNGRNMAMEPGETVFTKPIAGPFKAGDVAILQKLRIYSSVPPQWPVSTGAYQAQGYEVNEFGTGLTDNTLATTPIAGAVHASVFAVAPPIAIHGRPVVSGKKIIGILGDSIFSTGSNDSGSAQGYVGFGQRTFAANYATVNIGASGYGVVSLMSNATNATRMARQRKWLSLLGSGITDVFTNFGTNDISGQATDISAQVVSSLVALQAELAYFGIRLTVMTCCPRTNTTNNGVNSIDTAAGWTNVTALNAAIIAAFPGRYYDLNAFMRDPSNANIWNTTRNPGAVDGIHPSFADHVACADVNTAGSFAAALPALLA